MASENGGGGGFGWGFVLGGLIGLVAGAYLATGPGREQVESLRSKTIELTGTGMDRMKQMANDPEHPLGRAMQEGVAAARRMREQLETQREADSAAAESAGGGEGRKA
ncbi:MAG TPA: hypothetical protein VK131_08320 [Candidatus Acidoferrales bacterium]|nr:hypothetical protein [Candidatus Acidoferrales bacterium]